MKVFLKNVIIKKFLIVLVTIVMVSNFIMPNYVCAKDNEAGSKLVNGFFYLLAWGGDAILSTMQKLMMGTGALYEDDVYSIKYSPGIVFSNTVPALDIDFIGADESYNDTVDRKWTDVNSEEEMVLLIEESSIDKSSFQLYMTGQNLSKWDDGFSIPGAEQVEKTGGGFMLKFINFSAAWTNYFIWGDLGRIKKVLPDDFGMGDNLYIYMYGDYMYMIVEQATSRDLTIYRCPKASLNQNVEHIPLDSSAYTLKSNISDWYNALRTIALIGLLSVLIYVGIKIILSSASAQDKAKYKNMLKDWLVAVCILFVLHYVMAFMINITGELNGIIKNTATELTDVGNTTDKLMNTVREQVGDIEQNTTLEMAGYTVMYLALVILTGAFTIQYLKRVVFMAFLTMIAPMIALTYPLDKIKDGKAQAFSYWLREYIFNCLIQPVHLLIYTITITNALSFATSNVLYAIVALAFMLPAEKIIKEMFGMKSSSPVGTLGAAAGGAMVMSMINKLKAKPPKDDAGAGASSGSGVRTANPINASPTTPVASALGSNSANSSPNNVSLTNSNLTNSSLTNSNLTNSNATNSTLTNSNATNASLTNSNLTNSNAANASLTNSNLTNSNAANASLTNSTLTNSNIANSNATNANATNASTTMSIPNVISTTTTSTALPVSPSSITGSKTRNWGDRHIKGVNNVASGVGKFTRAGGGALLGLAAGTVGLASQVADGDIFDNTDKAFTQTLGAAVVGYAAGSNLTGQALNLGRKANDWLDKKELGIEAYNNREFDRKVYQSDGYKMIAQDPTIIKNCKDKKVSVAHAVQDFLDRGITDTTKIREALQNDIGGEAYNTFTKAGVDSPDKMSKLQKEGITAEVFKDVFKNNGIDDVSKILKLKKDKPRMSNAEIANRMAIAKMAPNGMKNFVPWAKAKFGISDVDAENLYNQIVDFF